MRHHHPEKLQIIDQSLSLSKLIADVEAAGFYLRSVTPYRLFHDVDEYVSLVFAKRTGLKQVRVDSVIRRLIRNVAVRLS